MPVVAGVDSSTQSCTVELRDADSGALIGSGRVAHPPTNPPQSEQDATRWWDALQRALAVAVADAGIDASEIRAISVAAQCHGLVMLGRDGRPLRSVKLWNDTTSAPQSLRLVEEMGVAGWVQAVGSVPAPAFTITKLAWMREHEPEHLKALAAVLVPHDYLTYRLTGSFVTDRSDASGTGYYASHEQRWRTDLLERFVDPAVDWAAVLPAVLGPNARAGTVTRSVASQLGLRDDVIVGAGAGDQHAGAAGLGMRDGEVAYSLGTSGVVMTHCANPVFDEAGYVNGVANISGGYLPLVCTLNSTKVTDTMARLLGVTLEDLAQLALATPDREGRPVFAAYLDGERSPSRPGARGILASLSNETTREELALAAFEGVLFGLVRGHERISALGGDAGGTVLAIGGGARSRAYRQVLADVLGTEVVVRDAQEATARGSAVQAAAVLAGRGVSEVQQAWAPPVVSSTEPRSASWARRARERYETLADWNGFDE